MEIGERIRTEIKRIFLDRWEKRQGRVVPDDSSITLGNQGIELKVAVLYADLANSTNIVKQFPSTIAAEIYKSFLRTSSLIIEEHGGEITAFDGDRIMAVFHGEFPNNTAIITALKINYAIKYIVEPELKSVYSSVANYNFEFGIGIDTGDILVTKTGVRGANDLLWLGNPSNIAAKLCSIRGTGKPIWISEQTYNNLFGKSKFAKTSEDMWSGPFEYLGINIYGSSYIWEFN